MSGWSRLETHSGSAVPPHQPLPSIFELKEKNHGVSKLVTPHTRIRGFTRAHGGFGPKPCKRLNTPSLIWYPTRKEKPNIRTRSCKSLGNVFLFRADRSGSVTTVLPCHTFYSGNWCEGGANHRPTDLQHPGLPVTGQAANSTRTSWSRRDRNSGAAAFHFRLPSSRARSAAGTHGELGHRRSCGQRRKCLVYGPGLGCNNSANFLFGADN